MVWSCLIHRSRILNSCWFFHSLARLIFCRWYSYKFWPFAAGVIIDKLFTLEHYKPSLVPSISRRLMMSPPRQHTVQRVQELWLHRHGTSFWICCRINSNQFESVSQCGPVWFCSVLVGLSLSMYVICMSIMSCTCFSWITGSSLGAVAASLTFIVSHGFVHLGYDGSKWHAMLLWRIEASSYFTTWRLTQSPSSNCKSCNLQECHESGASVGASRSLKFRARSRSPKTGTETTTKWPI